MRMNKGAAQLFFRGSVAACCCNVQTCKRRRAGVVGRRRPDRKNPKMLRLVMVPALFEYPTGTRSNLGPIKGHGSATAGLEVTYVRNLLGDWALYLSSSWVITRGTCPPPHGLFFHGEKGVALEVRSLRYRLSFGENKIGKLSIYEKNRYHTGVTVFLMNWTLIKVCGCTLNFLINEQRRNTYGGIWNLPISPTTFVRLRRRTGKETDKYSIWETSRPIPTVSIRRDIVALEIKYRRLMVLRAHRVIVSQLFFYAEKCLIGKRIWIRARRVCMCATSLRIDFLGTYLLGA